MKLADVAKYLANCFWLIVPVLALDLLFADRLPSVLQMPSF